MTIHLVETYEEDACIAVARHIAALLDEGQVGRAWPCLSGTRGSAGVRYCCSQQPGCVLGSAPRRSWPGAAATPAVLLLLLLLQVKTALADTTGSVFLQKCITAATEGRWDELIKQLSAHLDLVFSKCSDKGAWPGVVAGAGWCDLAVGVTRWRIRCCVCCLCALATGNTPDT